MGVGLGIGIDTSASGQGIDTNASGPQGAAPPADTELINSNLVDGELIDDNLSDFSVLED